ncbi:DNA-methyltransferase [Altererythrobacter xiamenensis]|uniref:DNA-methyltransferase n=1 Tax=Altererythrobacter xiamenensis TaxID=1316679 RepID=UPI0013563FC3|nr:site-specific DNA-methyltransferase [Altererythrobacter xiamenensis]
MIFTDCPWNIPIAGFVSGLGKVKHQDFKMGAGEMPKEEFVDFCDRFHELGAANLIDGGVFYSCIDWRSADVIMKSGRRAGLRHINTAVWNKGSGGMGSPWRSAHEFIVIFCKGKKCAVNNIELGKHGRDRTNVWSYPGANRKGSSASKALANHPTPKPVEMVRDALLDVSNRGGIVLDPFMGSGTTIIAAEQCGRVARGIELDPAYVDVAVRRWEELIGRPAMHAETGLSFSEMAEKRLAKDDVANAA